MNFADLVTRNSAEWAAIAGSDRWSWEGMLPYFKATESFVPSKTQVQRDASNDEHHGRNGPIKVGNHRCTFLCFRTAD